MGAEWSRAGRIYEAIHPWLLSIVGTAPLEFPCCNRLDTACREFTLPPKARLWPICHLHPDGLGRLPNSLFIFGCLLLTISMLYSLEWEQRTLKCIPVYSIAMRVQHAWRAIVRFSLQKRVCWIIL